MAPPVPGLDVQQSVLSETVLEVMYTSNLDIYLNLTHVSTNTRINNGKVKEQLLPGWPLTTKCCVRFVVYMILGLMLRKL